ncbi:alpha-L-fucosidase [uncultured Sunxiuqinia sp.]|uniref:alpha-L-fucosidase n=1 Tax=uncultured Sunxiuqinia sp. TaxID=1573825 RepID=UPI00262780E3|nr:alpha-L-fucosidase [uncultured Sunxiuqinia sp.]
MPKQILLILLSTILFTISARAQWSVLESDTSNHAKWNLVQRFSTEEWNASNFASEDEMQWFNDTRYGMFIHFGLSTYIGKELSWGMCYTRKAPDGMGGGHGPIADSVWVKYPEHFVFENFDARKWVDIAQKAGMKYIVTIAKHHDGFHLWDTKYSDFKVTNTPFGRDYLKEIADACHEAGMKFGIYYSQRDWYHPDYEPLDTSLIEPIRQPPYYKARPGVTEIKPGPNHQKYIDYQFNVVRELCTNYGKVDVFWFDACWWGGMFTADMWQSEKLTRMIRELQPGIIINNRASIPGDFDTPEQKIGMYQERSWESCLTLCSSWSWSDTPVKTKKQLVKIITATSCGNGNALLSWGPKWEGAFDPKQVHRLEEVGDWLQLYGHTIYETKGGPWYPENWGGSTYKGNKVYVHVTDVLTDRLLLPALNNRLKSVKCLTGGEIEYEQSPKAIVFDLTNVNDTKESIIVELEFENKIDGMAPHRGQLSKFSDPVYGSILWAKEELVGKEVLRVDLKEIVHATGIAISELTLNIKQKVKVEVSADGKEWKEIAKEVPEQGKWELTISNFSAGIQLPGVDTRYIRIHTTKSDSPELYIKNLVVYGK